MKEANPELKHKHAFGQAARNTKLHLEQARAATREAAEAITALGTGDGDASPPDRDVEMQAGLDPEPEPVCARPQRIDARRSHRVHPYNRT